ncbi:hypothetical protein ABZ485_28125 [Streptomyces albogriseolus]|uniref:hypothetical protein n=1 Tax=Streptomyces albogriseolus TaxID=1887 RepID=UPI00345F23A8
MHIRTTTAGILAVLALTLTACGSSDGDKAGAPATSTAASADPSTEPSLSIKQQCTEAVAEAAPGWDDWNYSPGGWQDDPRTPAECLPLADEEVPSRGNRAFMDALIAGLELADDPRARQ